MTKVLVIRFSSIGDVVLTTPIIRCLKSQINTVEVHVLTKVQFSPIFSANPNVDKVYALNNNEKELVKQLRSENYSHIIDLHKNIRSNYFKQKLKVRSTSFSKLNVQKWLAVNLKTWSLPDVHVVDRYFEAVRSLDVKNDQKGIDYFIPSDEELCLKEYFGSNPFLAVTVGAKFATKALPLDKMCAILAQTDIKNIALLGGKEDQDKAMSIEKSLKTKNIKNFCGLLSLNQSASVIRQSKVVLAHDTGLMHIAAAFKTPIVSVWGSTTPTFGMYPYRPNQKETFTVHEVNNLACRPCSKIGYQKCPKKHFKCMENQNNEEIVAQIQRFYATK